MNKDTDNTLRLVDQEGELLLECEIGDKYHKLILEVGLNKILKDSIEHWELEDEPEVDEFKTDKKGEPSKDSYTTSIVIGVINDDAFVTIPSELIKKMKWKDGDKIDIDVIDDCFDGPTGSFRWWGEVPSIVLRNLTKEK